MNETVFPAPVLSLFSHLGHPNCGASFSASRTAGMCHRGPDSRNKVPAIVLPCLPLQVHVELFEKLDTPTQYLTDVSGFLHTKFYHKRSWSSRCHIFTHRAHSSLTHAYMHTWTCLMDHVLSSHFPLKTFKLCLKKIHEHRAQKQMQEMDGKSVWWAEDITVMQTHSSLDMSTFCKEHKHIVS